MGIAYGIDKQYTLIQLCQVRVLNFLWTRGDNKPQAREELLQIVKEAWQSSRFASLGYTHIMSFQFLELYFFPINGLVRDVYYFRIVKNDFYFLTCTLGWIFKTLSSLFPLFRFSSLFFTKAKSILSLFLSKSTLAEILGHWEPCLF